MPSTQKLLLTDQKSWFGEQQQLVRLCDFRLCCKLQLLSNHYNYYLQLLSLSPASRIHQITMSRRESLQLHKRYSRESLSHCCQFVCDNNERIRDGTVARETSLFFSWPKILRVSYGLTRSLSSTQLVVCYNYNFYFIFIESFAFEAASSYKWFLDTLLRLL